MNVGAEENHPDQHQIDDWFLYGPQNPEIEALVRELTIGKGLRLAEVESLIVNALEEKLRLLGAS
jgi:hypothetical protein